MPTIGDIFEAELDEFRLFPPRVTTKNIVTHSELNPKLWDNNKKRLRPEVKERLDVIVEQFIAFLKLSVEPKIVDIIISGSNANYNYTDTSDLDLHIVVDIESMFKNQQTSTIAMTKEFLMAKKNQWNDHRNIRFHGVPVEVYVEDSTTPKSSGGIFSIKYDKWVVRPGKINYEKNAKAAEALAKVWEKKIQFALRSKDMAKMKEVMGDIYKARKTTLNAAPVGKMSGESSVENMAFKAIRAAGLIDKLNKAIDTKRDAELSLGEARIDEFFNSYGIKYHNKLNPALWDKNDELKPEVRNILIKIARNFIQFLGIPLKVEDIVFKGSNANYNYTNKSDIDLHIVAKMDKKYRDIVTSKRSLWKIKYKDVRIFGFPVEMGVDEPNKIHSSSAVYSVTRNQWVSKPEYSVPDIEKDKVKQLVKLWGNQLKVALRSGDIKTIQDTVGKIRQQRNKALDGTEGAEFRAPNVAYKRIRDTGILDKIDNLVKAKDNERYSLSKPGLLG